MNTILQDTLDEKFFKWIKGDHVGKVEEIIDFDGDFMVFKSGNRCNLNYKKDFLMPTNSEDPGLQIQKQTNNEIKLEDKPIIKNKKTNIVSEKISKLLDLSDGKIVHIDIKIPDEKTTLLLSLVEDDPINIIKSALLHKVSTQIDLLLNNIEEK